MKNTNCLQSKNGTTLVEVIATLVILSILAAISIPALLGFIDKTKKQQYLIEAQSLYGSLQAYTIEAYAVGNTDDINFYRDVLMNDINSKNNPIGPYLRIAYPPRSSIRGITLDSDNATVLELVYLVANYKITTGVDGATIEEIE